MIDCYWDYAGVMLPWSNTGSDTAVFGGTNGLVTLGEAITAESLIFQAAKYTIAGGGNTLTIGAGGLIIQAGSSPHSISSAGRSHATAAER
jgi:hypothetical protein